MVEMSFDWDIVCLSQNYRLCQTLGTKRSQLIMVGPSIKEKNGGSMQHGFMCITFKRI